tara:strand:+ start:44 stop:1309 length:1266 start_codon:yes stop_codon:yes gene_type:complete
MAYDTGGRWVPDEDLTWSRDTEAQQQALRLELSEAGLDWRHQGKYAFRTNIWGDLSEGERFDVLQQYDTWYDKGGQLALNDEAWGLDIERGITYDDAKTWDTQAKFHNLTGGDVRRITVGEDIEKKTEYEDAQGNTVTEYGRKGEGGVGIAGDKTGYDWISLTNPYKYSDKVRGTLVGQAKDAEGKHLSTTYTLREYPMDWADYTHDDLYRAAIDEVLETDHNMFMGPGADYDNAKQVRYADAEINKWVKKRYDQAREEGRDGAWAEAQVQADIELQILRGKAYNQRYPEGKNTRGFLHNQQVQIRKYKQFQKFDEETGTVSRYHPLTGELREEHTYQAPAPPVRMTITGDRTLEDVDAGRYYSPTVGFEQKITGSLADEPDPIDKPTLSIRRLGPLDDEGQGKARKPDNIKGWKDSGVVT